MRKLLDSTAQAKITALGKSKVSNDGMTIHCQIVRFVNSSGTSELDTYGGDCQLELKPVHVDKLTDKPNVLRTNAVTGKKEVRCRVKYEDKAEQYLKHWAPDAIAGTYDGAFSPILDYWNRDRSTVADHVWVPLDDMVWFGKIWRGATPDPSVLRSGTEITISASFDQYLSIPKARGRAKAADAPKESVPLATAPTALPPVSHDDDGNNDDNVDGIPYGALIAATQVAESQHRSTQDLKRAPTIRYIMATNNGFQLSENNSGSTSSFELFNNGIDPRAHFLRLPTWDGDNYCIVLPLSGYQDDKEELSDAEPGPSTMRMPLLSLNKDDYEKPPKGQDQQSTLRESKKTIRMMIMQYGQGTPDASRDLPYTVETTTYTNHIWGLGITHLSTWLKFGRIPWQGVAICTVNAADTRRLDINQPGVASAHNHAGKLDCWIKTVHWDIRSTLEKEGIRVPKSLVARLYADIYRRGKMDDDTEFVSCNMGSLDALRASPFKNTLNDGGDGIAYNLNEYRGEAGHIIDNYDLYALLHLPIPYNLMNNGNPDTTAVQEYWTQSLATLRELDDAELVKVLLGEQTIADIDTYTSEEVDALRKLGNDRDRALAWPGRGPEHKRVYKKSVVSSNPASRGFDFLIYAVKPASDVEADEDAKSDDDDDENEDSLYEQQQQQQQQQQASKTKKKDSVASSKSKTGKPRSKARMPPK